MRLPRQEENLQFLRMFDFTYDSSAGRVSPRSPGGAPPRPSAPAPSSSEPPAASSKPRPPKASVPAAEASAVTAAAAPPAVLSSTHGSSGVERTATAQCGRIACRCR